MTDLLGTDIVWSGDDLVVDPSGDIALETGAQCLATDLAHRLGLWRGSYFRHPEHGMPWQSYHQGEADASTYLAVAQELEREAERDERVEPGSARARVRRWTLERVEFSLTVKPIGEAHALNLVIGGGLDRLTVEEIRRGS